MTNTNTKLSKAMRAVLESMQRDAGKLDDGRYCSRWDTVTARATQAKQTLRALRRRGLVACVNENTGLAWRTVWRLTEEGNEMIEARTTSPAGQVIWVQLPVTRATYAEVRGTLKELHDALGHWGGLGKSDTWHRTCSVQSEAQALIVRNREKFPAEVVALIDPDGKNNGLTRMRVLYALTLNSPKIRAQVSV